jgi:hypothetical protein
MTEADLNPTLASCDVCVIMDGDERLKADVVWCQRCEAYVCRDCRNRPFRRFMAAWKRRLSRTA